MPTWSNTRTIWARSSSRFTPRASSTSAEPEAEVEARFPCFTTGIPAAAARIDAMVEMFAVLAPSPPVPTMSTTFVGRSMCLAKARISSARPCSSATSTPRSASKARSAETRTSSSDPDMMARIMSRDWS